MRGELTLEIFFANDLREPLQVGCADNVASARVRMEQIAKERPGWYFVWDRDNLRVIARIDTTRPEGVQAEARRIA